MKRTKQRKKPFGCLYGFIILLFLLLFLYWQNYGLQITRYVLDFTNLPKEFDGLRIVQVSDMHGMYFGLKNNTLVRKIKDQNPDILVLTGDMISSHAKDGQAFLDFLEGMGNKIPAYMCMGNHEQIAERYEAESKYDYGYQDFINKVKASGVIVLDNEMLRIERENQSINLYGLTIELYHYSTREPEYADDSLLLQTHYIDEVLKKPADGFNILLAHNPSYFSEYSEWGADLTLSGHMHGGIIRVPFKGGLLSPERIFFPEYDAGVFEKGNNKMIVNRGLGYSQINFRLFNMPEISVITLKSNQ